jgi:hypothetical protein
MATAADIVITRLALTSHGRPPLAKVVAPARHIIPIAIAFVIGDTVPLVCQSRRAGPNSGDRKSLSFHCGEERMKQPVANSRKGVDGSKGRNAPIAASPTKPIPSARYTTGNILSSAGFGKLTATNDFKSQSNPLTTTACMRSGTRPARSRLRKLRLDSLREEYSEARNLFLAETQ